MLEMLMHDFCLHVILYIIEQMVSFFSVWSHLIKTTKIELHFLAKLTNKTKSFHMLQK